MKPFYLLLTLSAYLFFFSACQQETEQATDHAQIKTEIQEIENAWAVAMNNKDIDALMAMYADDAVSMPDNAPSLKGKAAIRKNQEQEFMTMPAGVTYSFETLDIFGDANTVTETGTTTVKDASGKVTGTGKYLCVFEKRDGKYLVVREIYNNDKQSQTAFNKSIHLFDLPEDVTEKEWASALRHMNSVIEDMGYAGAGYQFYKVESDEVKDHRYFFEGIWPNAEAYEKIHGAPAYAEASNKLNPLYEKIKQVEIYRKMTRVE